MLARRLLAEFLGTLLLLATVVGSGIMAAQLADGNDAVSLLANAGATAAALYVLIVLFGPVSGAHFNPAVTLALRLRGELGTREALAYIMVQSVAAIAGVMLAHAMFELPLLQPGERMRTGGAQWLSEAVASFGLIVAILLGRRQRPDAIPVLVASYIFAAYWFTASTSFANPAVTLARALTRTFAGIRLENVGGFALAQLAGTLLALGAVALLAPSTNVGTQSAERRSAA
jgi:glycerol uptake facilitator-like aquaporin